MTQTGPTKLDRKIVVALNKRHLSEKQKLRNVAKKAEVKK
jgi:hypothetical protein